MTDKEQIMIDGVDILDCDNYYVEQETDQVKCNLSSEYCRENKNCLFKQLARKTQECEGLKEELAAYKKLLDNSEFRVALTDVRTGEREIWRELGSKADRYLKALEEIKEVTKTLNTNGLCFYDDINDCSNCDMNTDCNYLRKYKILDIINKAKGEMNG